MSGNNNASQDNNRYDVTINTRSEGTQTYGNVDARRAQDLESVIDADPGENVRWTRTVQR